MNDAKVTLFESFANQVVSPPLHQCLVGDSGRAELESREVLSSWWRSYLGLENGAFIWFGLGEVICQFLYAIYRNSGSLDVFGKSAVLNGAVHREYRKYGEDHPARKAENTMHGLQSFLHLKDNKQKCRGVCSVIISVKGVLLILLQRIMSVAIVAFGGGGCSRF